MITIVKKYMPLEEILKIENRKNHLKTHHPNTATVFILIILFSTFLMYVFFWYIFSIYLYIFVNIL